ncbi:hypothetical protein PS1_044315 [Malus domestica]
MNHFTEDLARILESDGPWWRVEKDVTILWFLLELCASSKMHGFSERSWTLCRFNGRRRKLTWELVR